MKHSTKRPKSLYKYRPWSNTLKRKESGIVEEVNYTEKLLTERCFYCQSPHDFDDPHDSFTGPSATGSELDIDRFVIERMALVVKAMKETGATSLVQLAKLNDPRALGALSGIAGQDARKGYRVLSLSTKSSCEQMWAFYADYHKGICLEFNGQHSFFEEIRPVSYSAEPPAPELNNFDDLAYSKSEAWAYQDEWRLRSNSEFLEFPTGLLRRVVIGYRFPELQYQSLLDSLIAGGHKVVIEQMQRIPGTYHFTTVERGCTEKIPNPF